MEEDSLSQHPVQSRARSLPSFGRRHFHGTRFGGPFVLRTSLSGKRGRPTHSRVADFFRYRQPRLRFGRGRSEEIAGALDGLVRRRVFAAVSSTVREGGDGRAYRLFTVGFLYTVGKCCSHTAFLSLLSPPPRAALCCGRNYCPPRRISSMRPLRHRKLAGTEKGRRCNVVGAV